MRSAYLLEQTCHLGGASMKLPGSWNQDSQSLSLCSAISVEQAAVIFQQEGCRATAQKTCLHFNITIVKSGPRTEECLGAVGASQ